MTAWLAVLLTIAGPQAAAPPAPSPGNAEMARMFAADQAVRENIKPEQWKDPAFVHRMIAEDDARRARTRVLLDSGALTTAEDYYAAAFVFQHGMEAKDYLLAHALASAAAAKGKTGAVTMEPYDTALIPDALRTAVGVPVRSEQDKRPETMRATAPK